jgi:deoxyadenosine/deoxycytidine kinase
MPLICLEGPSAVGKTTTCKALAEQYNAYIVPEVNQLFDRPTPEPTYWYFERQVERWVLAQEKLETHELVVFDGDPFQPLWYNWSFNFVDWQPLSVLRNFYRQHIVAQTLGFPDGYILLIANESQLLQRKENDPTRTRSGFTKNLLVIEPQKRYFQEMNSKIPGFVRLIESTNIEQNIKNIIQELPSFSKPPEHPYSLTFFDYLIEWLYKNTAR